MNSLFFLGSIALTFPESSAITSECPCGFFHSYISQIIQSVSAIRIHFSVLSILVSFNYTVPFVNDIANVCSSNHLIEVIPPSV
jgi:hypothetical protein